jgi:hypothetical protein
MKIARATRQSMRHLARHHARARICAAVESGEVAISGHFVEKHTEIDNNWG